MERQCEVCGRDDDKVMSSKISGMTLCKKHAGQYYKYGEFKDSIPRTKFDPNEIVVHDNYAEVILYSKDKEIARTKIDISNIEKISDYKWLMNSRGYVISRGVKKNKSIYLHRYLLNPKKESVVDHINHDKLDNRESNLRECDSVDNARNRLANSSDHFSIYKGVGFSRGVNKYSSGIKVDGKSYNLGYFNTEEEAAIAYDINAIHFFKDYAHTNFDKSKYNNLKDFEHLLFKNKKRNRKNTNRFRGIYKDKGKWQVMFQHDKRYIYLGRYENERDAVEVYNQYIIKYNIDRELYDIDI